MKQTVEAAIEHQNKFKACDGEGTLSGFTNGMHAQSYESFIEGAEWMAESLKAKEYEIKEKAIAAFKENCPCWSGFPQDRKCDGCDWLKDFCNKLDG